MPFRDAVTGGLERIASRLGNPSFDWQDESYECCPGSAGETLILGDGGQEQQADIVLNVRRALFASDILPREQQTITYQSKAYRIATVHLDPSGAAVKLICVSAKRGV
jgi:hypothetical protein